MTSLLRQIQTYVLTLLILSVLLPSVHAQVKGVDILGKKDRITIPFEMEQGFIIVNVEMNRRIPLRMIFDTGAENTILFDKELAEMTNVQFGRKVTLSGSDLDSVIEASICRNIKFELDRGSMVTRDIIVLDRNNFHLREKIGIEINGILGGSFFANLIVKIDYRRKRVHFYRADKFKHNMKGYAELPIKVVANKPYVQAELSMASLNTVKAQLLLDTGAALPFLLHANTDPDIVVPERTMLGTVGFGLSGPIKGFLGKTDYLRFGNYTYENIITNFQDVYYFVEGSPILKRNGILGNVLLSRFTIIIDYVNEKVYFKGGKKYNREFAYDKSGMNVLAFGEDLKRFMISSIIGGSPSAQAGLEPGDVILKMNRRSARNLSLEYITSSLAKSSGKKIRLTILRDGVKMKKTFLLQDWYLPVGAFEDEG